MSSTVVAEPVVTTWHPRHGMSTTTCRFRYEPTDPYAVTVGTIRADGRSATWTFARSLLADGTAGHAGLGDVRIWRVTSDDSLVALALSGPSGTAHVYAPLGAVVAFLAASNSAVAPGTEHLVPDFEAGLEALLGDADG
jgi:hypothetical protein